jgi:sugar phosphate isomerase/epimerase
MKRRKFISIAATGIIVLPAFSRNLHSPESQKSNIRLGGPVFEEYNSPDEWVAALKMAGYRAAYCPVEQTDDETTIQSYRKAAEQNDIVIAEVGAWSNPISPVETTAKTAIDKCIDSLALADRIGARCCVNISGSRHPQHWAGPHPDNLTPATFDLIVETTRKIIDAVKPTNSYYTVEAMPWSYPDSADLYLKLMKAIGRNRFAVHLDPVNWVNCPLVYFKNGEMIRNAFKKLGPYIKSCHAKDIIINEQIYVPQFSEVRPGLGKLDYRVFLSELSKLDDVPLMMEHLQSAEEYSLAAEYISAIDYL